MKPSFFCAYRAVAHVPKDRDPWTIDNRRIGSPDGVRTLKEAIARGARRQVRFVLTPLRRELLRLRKRVTELQTMVMALRRSAHGWKRVLAAAPPVPHVSEEDAKAARLSPRLIRSLRVRLGLSQSALARLVGVSAPAVAHWEGDILVVEYTNFAADANGTASKRVTERWKRLDETHLLYGFTLDDPGTRTKPYSVEFVMWRLTDQEQLVEYACHEGNVGLEFTLSAARAKDREEAAEEGK
jgi:transcriptional regulator with XRE-family HTH domain